MAGEPKKEEPKKEEPGRRMVGGADEGVAWADAMEAAQPPKEKDGKNPPTQEPPPK